MAFKFFRRRKKTVLIVMMLLMVAFLVPTLFQRCGSGSGRDEVIGHINEKDVTIRMIRAAEVDLHLLRRSLRLGTGRRTGEGAFGAFLTINREQDAGLAWMLLLHEAGQMGIAIEENQVDAFLAESGLTGEAYQRELANLRESGGYTEKHLRRTVANYLMVTTAFKTTEMNTIPSLPELRHTFGDLQERIQLAMVALPAEDFTADAPEPSEDAVFEQFDRHKHLAAQGPNNKTDFGFGYRLADRLEIAWLFIDEGPVARAVEPLEQQMMDYWDKHKGELKKRIPTRLPADGGQAPTTSTAPADTQPTEPKFREVVIESFSQAKPQIRQILMPGAVDARMSEIISLARRTAQRFGDVEQPYSAAAGAMIHPADALLARKVGPLPFAKAPLEAIIEELEDLAKVKIVYPFGKHDKFTLDSKIIVKIKPWGNISLGEALKRIGKQAKCPPIKWATCDGMDGVLFASEPVNLVPISAGRTGMVGFAEVYRHELLGRAGLKSSAGPDAGRPGAQSLLAIAATAEVFQPPGRRHEPLIKPGDDFDRTTYVSGPLRGRLLWRLVRAEADHAPLRLTDEIRKQVVGDLKTVFGFKKALAAAEAMKAELEKSDVDLEKLADNKKLNFSKTAPFARKTMQYQTGRIFWTNVLDVGADKQFIESAFALVPADPDEPGDDKPAAVIPLRRQRKVMLIQRIEYEPVTTAVFDEWGSYIAGMTLVRRRWEWTAAVWFSSQSVAERVNYRPKHPSE